MDITNLKLNEQQFNNFIDVCLPLDTFLGIFNDVGPWCSGGCCKIGGFL